MTDDNRRQERDIGEQTRGLEELVASERRGEDVDTCHVEA
jgi:hypothetical protein